jgi:hypothetical protein
MEVPPIFSTEDLGVLNVLHGQAQEQKWKAGAIALPLARSGNEPGIFHQFSPVPF